MSFAVYTAGTVKGDGLQGHRFNVSLSPLEALLQYVCTFTTRYYTAHLFYRFEFSCRIYRLGFAGHPDGTRTASESDSINDRLMIGRCKKNGALCRSIQAKLPVR